MYGFPKGRLAMLLQYAAGKQQKSRSSRSLNFPLQETRHNISGTAQLSWLKKRRNINKLMKKKYTRRNKNYLF